MASIKIDALSAIKNVNDKIELITDLTSTTSKGVFSLTQVLTDQVLAATQAESDITGTGDIAFTVQGNVDSAALNQPPTNISLSSTSVDAVSRTLTIGTLTTTDVDQNPGVDFKYELANVPGSDHASFFNINQATAEVSLIAQSDFDTKPMYNITILSTDDGGKTFSKTFAIEGYNTRTLTAGVDSGTNFITTGGNDTFFANTSGYLATGDVLDAGTGTDNLVAVHSSGSTSTTINPTLSNFENIDITLTDNHATASTTTLNLDKSPGVESVTFKNNSFIAAAETVVLSGVNTSTTMTISDPAGAASTRANNYTVTYAGVTGTADSAEVNVEMTAMDGELGTITMAGVEKVTVNSSGGFDASYTLATPNAKTLIINNEADLTASDSNAGTVTITSNLAETLNINSLGDLVLRDNTNKLSNLTSVNINSQTANKTVDLTSLTTTATALVTDGITINVRGAGNANIGVDTNFGTYNATSNPDKVTINATGSGDISVLYNNYSANTIITGSGNDAVTIASGNVLNNVDSIDLGDGDDAIVAIANYSSNNAIDLFHDDDVLTTDPIVENVEIARVTLDDPGGAASVSATSASFAATLELNGDIENTVHTIDNIGATNEIASIKFSDLTAGKTTILAGLTMTAGSNGATAAQVAEAFAGGVADSSDAGGATGAAMSGTLSGYNVAASGTSGTTVFTSTSTGNKTDLADSGTGADPFITITQGGMQTVKIGKTLDLTDTASALVLVQRDATIGAPAASIAITSDLLGTSAVGNINDLRANVVTAVTLDLASTDADVLTATVDEASFDKAISVKVTSVENVNFGAIDAANDATLDFTGVSGTLSVTVDTVNDYTIKGSSGTASTIIMGTGLDKDDIVIGGSSKTDSLTATINGLTSTTGDLLLTGVETLNLTISGASTLDLADVTGATNLTIDGSNNLIVSNALPDEIVTINSSAATGNMTYGVGAGTVAVTGGSGIDIVTGNSGVNNISTAGGNDIIKFAGTHLTYEDTVNGGANANSLSYTSDEVIDLADFTNVTNVQTLTAENTVQMTGNLGALAASAGISTVTLNDDGDGDNLVIDAEFNTGLTVNLDDGDNALNASAYTGTLTIAITEAIANVANDTNTIVGGVGTADVISITADGTGITKANIAAFTKFEKLTIANDVTTGTIVLDDANVESGKTFTVNSADITTASNIFNLDASAEADGFLIVNGAAGIDKITMSQSSNGDNLSLGGAADIIYVASANLTSADTINGGAGTDVLTLTDASTVVDSAFTNITNLENITQGTASHNMVLTLGALSTAAGIVKVIGGTGTNALTVGSGYTGALTVELASGTDTIDGSAQTSGSLTVTAAQESIAADDTLTGGSTTDTLTITADGSAALLAADLVGLTKFDNINIANNAAIGISTHNNNVAASGIVAVNASAMTSAVLTFNASQETDGAYNVTTAGSGDHVITLGDGDDTVTANTGVNNLTLGAGSDTVIIATASLNSSDTFNFGTGTDDVIKMSDASTVIDADFTNITNLDRIAQNTASHGMNLTLGTAATAAGLTKVTGGTGTNSLVIGSSYTGSLTVDLAAGTDTINGSAQTSGSLTVTAAVASITSADTITGGSATDILTITTDGSTSLTSANLANVTAFGTIQSVGNNAFNITMHDNNSVSANISFNASSLTTGALTFNSSAEDDGSYTLTAGGGDDSITFGNGVDVIKFANGKLTSADTVNGGATGTNTLKFTNTTTLADADFTGVTNFQNLTLENLSNDLTLVMDTEVDQAGIVSVTTGTGTNSITVGSNYDLNLTVALGAGTDTVNGANQSGGSLTVTAEQDSISGDTLTGGSSATNTLSITGGGTALDANDMANITAFNTIQSATNAALSITMNNANVASGANVAFNASSLTSTALTFNAATEVDGTYTLTAGAGDDNITLGSGADILLIATDNLTSSDTINGGGGTDILKLTNASTVIDADFTNVTNVETITQNTA
ncbi:MAG: hypothetical protein CL692_05885, partial [Cellvibrionales bacterium]|nr:hypothetical protein [Cellvibrionales bacterium]